jgi:hypothetical protein
MRRTDFPVSADGRKGGDKNCFYCNAPVGGQHNAGCVQRDRTVILKINATMLVEVPEDWDVEQVNFMYGGDGSFCMNNLVDMLVRQRAQLKEGCLCGKAHGKFVREATEKDEEDFAYPGWKQT